MGKKWMIPVSTAAPTPTAAPQQQTPMQMQVGASIDPLSMLIMTMNANPYIVGMFMLLLNLGGRFLSLELTKKQEAFLQAPWIRPLIFFTVVFVATRNLVAAFWVTLLFFFIIWVVANENSAFCMIPSWCENTDSGSEPKQVYEQNIEKLKTMAYSLF